MPQVEHPYQLKHSFRDPVHGFIRVSDEERRLIDSPPVQRLRRIHQLGTGFLVYHGAEHSRFGHSLGTMHLAGRAFEQINDKQQGLLGRGKELSRNWQIMRIAGLLHDIGHTPFSHAAEELLPARADGKGHLRHEDYSAVILRNHLDTEIRSAFLAAGITAGDLDALFKGDLGRLGRPARIMQQLLSGEVDVDRMDYLLRDSLYTGVAYGHFDVERLVECITAHRIRGQRTLAFERGGLGALEGFIYARYFMYTQVYLHDVRCFYDIMLREALTELLEGGGFNGRYPNPADVDAFLKMDDVWAMAGLTELAEAGVGAAKCIVERRNWRTVAETSAHPTAIQVTAWHAARHEIEKEFGVDAFRFDVPTKKVFQPTEPQPYQRQTEGEGSPVVIVDETGSRPARLIEEESTLVDEISRNPVMYMRLYARPDVEDPIRERWERLTT